MNKNSVIISNRKKELKNVTLIGIIINIILMILKLIIGIVFNSSAMIADGIHSVEDMIASMCSYIGIRLSLKKKNKKHPNGYGKIEYFISLIISIIMVVTSMTMLKSSISNLINGNIVNYNTLLLIVCVITIILKGIAYLYTNSIYKRTNNILILALKEDHRNDIFIMIGISIGIVLSVFNIYVVDSIISIIISIWIGITGIKIFKSSYEILTDTNLSEERINKIKDVIYSFDEIKEIIDIVGNPIGEKYILIIQARLFNNYNIEYICKLRYEVKEIITNKFDYIYDVIFIECY